MWLILEMISASSQRIARRVQLHFRDKEKWCLGNSPKVTSLLWVECWAISRWSKVAPYSLWLHCTASQFYKFKHSEGFYLLICFVSISVTIIGFGAMATAATIMLLACQFSRMAGHVNDGWLSCWHNFVLLTSLPYGCAFPLENPTSL